MNVDRDPNDLARTQEEWRRRQALDNELQADPELAEGSAGGGRIALFAIAVIAILGVVLYGLNSTPTDTASNTPAQTTSSGAAPGKMSPNSNPGQTTGSAPAPKAAPPAANPAAPAGGANTQ
jgi:hypothetical protein